MIFDRIHIDGRTAPGDAAQWSSDGYERAVTAQLTQIGSTLLGRLLARHLNRSMTIAPTTTLAQENAFATPVHYLDATPEGAVYHYCADLRTTPLVETGTPMLDSNGVGVRGHGGGTNVRLLYTPGTWVRAGQRTHTGPGAAPDEILFHEMVHAIREMTGRAICHPVGGGYETFEEFIAVIVTNMYQSERGRAPRRNHLAFNYVFSQDRYYNSGVHVGLVHRLCREEPLLTRDLASVPFDRCPFNPFLTYY